MELFNSSISGQKSCLGRNQNRLWPLNDWRRQWSWFFLSEIKQRIWTWNYCEFFWYFEVLRFDHNSKWRLLNCHLWWWKSERNWMLPFVSYLATSVWLSLNWYWAVFFYVRQILSGMARHRSISTVHTLRQLFTADTTKPDCYVNYKAKKIFEIG